MYQRSKEFEDWVQKEISRPKTKTTKAEKRKRKMLNKSRKMNRGKK